jgi:hypothetical protein
MGSGAVVIEVTLRIIVMDAEHARQKRERGRGAARPGQGGVSAQVENGNCWRPGRASFPWQIPTAWIAWKSFPALSRRSAGDAQIRPIMNAEIDRALDATGSLASPFLRSGSGVDWGNRRVDPQFLSNVGEFDWVGQTPIRHHCPKLG